MQTRTKAEAYKSISSAVYAGPRRGFDINTYTTIHQNAHQDLERLREPVAENKKVRDYLQGITDPQCSAIKLAVLSNQALLNDFKEAINYVVGAIDILTTNSPAVTRRIAEVNTERGRGGYNGRGRQGGRGHSRFPSQGRGGYSSRGGGGRYQNNRRGRGRGRGSYQGNLGRGR